uniref:Putative secreted protein n=1 Tax=Anopheles marajoara TaxID=58244 RepID=A0A2M4C9M7_9DIPT
MKRFFCIFFFFFLCYPFCLRTVCDTFLASLVATAFTSMSFLDGGAQLQFLRFFLYHQFTPRAHFETHQIYKQFVIRRNKIHPQPLPAERRSV